MSAFDEWYKPESISEGERQEIRGTEHFMRWAFYAGMERAAEMVVTVSRESEKRGFEGFANRVTEIAEGIRKEIEK